MALEGNLADMSLLDLLRIFQRGARSGRLLLWTETEWAMVWFRTGQAAHAVVLDQAQRRPVAAGEPALMHVLGWPGGRFRFLAAARPELYLVTIKRPISALIAEVLRPGGAVAEPLARPELAAQTPLRVLPQLPGDDSVHLSVQEWSVLIKVERYPTPAAIAAQVELELDEALAIVGRLITLGLVGIAPATAPADRKPPLERAQALGAPETAANRLSVAIRRRLSDTGA